MTALFYEPPKGEKGFPGKEDGTSSALRADSIAYNSHNSSASLVQNQHSISV
jgi:hypothetical protein